MWRSNSYPAQTCTEQATPNHSSTVVEPRAQVPPLPTTVRAVKDSRSLKSGRTLVVCLDGTGDKFDNDNSNVVNFVACLKKDDATQLTYYQSGIGTYAGHGLKKRVSAAFDMALGSGLGMHIRNAYSFLMQNYIEGDRICLLGFSRGSYTVRCLAGMLHKVGLLPAYNKEQLSFAYRMYKNDTPNGWIMSAEFKKTFSMDVTVYFVGVWDCVASVGFIPRTLPFSKSPTNMIGHFRHAMALDEHRAKFEVCQWQEQDLDAIENQNENIPWPKSNAKASKASQLGKSKEKGVALQKRMAYQFDNNNPSLPDCASTDVREIWFTGCHADVGGGAVPNGERHMLSRIPLRWMIRQCFECETGILFATAALVATGLDIRTLWPVYQATQKPVIGPSPKMLEGYKAGSLPPLRRRSEALELQNGEKKAGADSDDLRSSTDDELDLEILPEHAEDHFDSLSPINDQLVQARGWWILEFWPVKVLVLKRMKSGEAKARGWEKSVGMNLGRHRAVRDGEPCMHWTVERRMAEIGYKIKCREGDNTVWMVSA